MNSSIATKIAFALVGALLFSAPMARALSSTTQVAWEGKPVGEVPGWPEGAIDLVNDPLRTAGWNPWFSELPNDVNFYEYRIRDTDDVNRLLQSLAAIKATNVMVRLNPGRGARTHQFTTAASGQNASAVEFSLGNQAQLSAWYQRLAESKPGVRKFGIHEYKEAPVASPPMLALYVGHATMDLKQLKIPAGVKVVADIEPVEKGAEEQVKAIKAFMAEHKFEVGKPTAAQPSPSPQNAAWVESCLAHLETIKPGMTRREVERKLTMDGGLQSVSPIRFTHPDCAYFKLKVEFDFKKNAADQGRAISSPDDKVTHVSKPYLERPFLD